MREQTALPPTRQPASTSPTPYGRFRPAILRKIFPAAALYLSRAKENGTCASFHGTDLVHPCQEVGTAGRPEDLGAGAVNGCDQA